MNRSDAFCLSGVLFCFLFASCLELSQEAVIWGHWQGSYDDKEVSSVFSRDGTCVIKFDDNTIQGKYELDFLKKPITLTIRNISQLNHPLYTIVDFIRRDSIRIAELAPKWRLRPISFETGKTIHLKRISLGN